MRIHPSNEQIMATRGGKSSFASSFCSPAQALEFYAKSEELMMLAQRKLDSLKSQREIKAVMFMDLCEACGVPMQSQKAEVVENLVKLLDELITLKMQCFTNDYRENPLPILFLEKTTSFASEMLYTKESGGKPKTKNCSLCGGEFIPVAQGNITCGECLLRGGKRRGGVR